MLAAMMTRRVAKPTSLVAPLRAATSVAPSVGLDTRGRKSAFVQSLEAAFEDHKSLAYHDFYDEMFRCFADADNDCDGLVSRDGFRFLIRLTARIPRRFGMAPRPAETHVSEEDYKAELNKLFDHIATRGRESIGFEEFMAWANSHVADKVLSISVTDRTSNLHTKAKEWTKGATSSRATKEYKEFYRFASYTFREADVNMSGRVELADFGKLLKSTETMPAMLGLSFKHITSVTDQQKLLKEMNTTGGGGVTFDQWLEYIFGMLCKKAGTTPPAFHRFHE